MLQSLICTLQQHMYRKHPVCILQTINAGIPSAWGAVSAWAHQQAWEYSWCLCTPVTDTHRVSPECKAAKNILPLQTYFGRTAASTFWDSSQFTFSRQRATPFPHQSHIISHFRQNLQMLPNFQNLLLANSSYAVAYKKPQKCNNYFSSNTDNWPLLTAAPVEPALRAYLALCLNFNQFLLHLLLVKTPNFNLQKN